MIGIIGAMDIEVDYIKSIMTDVEIVSVSGVDFYAGKAFGKDVVTAKCGIGKVYAALCCQTMILKFNPDVIINTGVAGALVSGLSVLDVVVADKVCQHDMDTSPLGDPKGLISGINKIFFPCDERYANLLSEVVSRLNLKGVSGTVASGDVFVADKALKNAISSEFSAVACEMEGGAMGHVCFVNNVPFCCLRAISDGDGAEMDYMEFSKLAADNACKIMEEFLKIV